jgi:hypothetical protein
MSASDIAAAAETFVSITGEIPDEWHDEEVDRLRASLAQTKLFGEELVVPESAALVECDDDESVIGVMLRRRAEDALSLVEAVRRAIASELETELRANASEERSMRATTRQAAKESLKRQREEAAKLPSKSREPLEETALPGPTEDAASDEDGGLPEEGVLQRSVVDGEVSLEGLMDLASLLGERRFVGDLPPEVVKPSGAAMEGGDAPRELAERLWRETLEREQREGDASLQYEAFRTVLEQLDEGLPVPENAGPSLDELRTAEESSPEVAVLGSPEVEAHPSAEESSPEDYAERLHEAQIAAGQELAATLQDIESMLSK